MIWFGILFILILLSMICTHAFVPVEHICLYAKSKKDLEYYLSACLFNAIWTTATIQLAISPGAFSPRLRLFGVALYIAGQTLIISARRVNDMFIPALVYVPPAWRTKRGIYRLCEHPGYIGFIFSAIGMTSILGQHWAMWPMFGYLGLIIRRMFLEDRLLSK